MFDKYGTNLSPENRDAWAKWFAFNYVWADLTIQLIDKVLGVIYSIRGNRKSDIKTIGGLILKVIFAEIVTGATMIGGIGITQIQNGELDPVEFVTNLINGNLSDLQLDKPVTLEEVFTALSGEATVEGKDFDVINFNGTEYTVRPLEQLIVDSSGQKVPWGSKLGQEIRQHWESKYGSQAHGTQVIESKNRGGMVGRPVGQYLNKGGMVGKKISHYKRKGLIAV